MMKIRRFGPVLFGLVAAFAFAQPASAQGVLDLAKGLLGISDEKPEIEYRERAPLVVPPKLQLRAPQEPASARNPNWPKDPDVAARKAAEAKKKIPEPEANGLSKNPVLSVDEMRGGRRAGLGVPDGTPERNMIDRPVLSNQEMRTIDREARERQSVAAGPIEPTRQWLTDPPTGYRRPAAGAPVSAPKGEGPKMLSDREMGDPFSTFNKKP